MIDDYLYDRVQGALERQLADPRIFQGMDK